MASHDFLIHSFLSFMFLTFVFVDSKKTITNGPVINVTKHFSFPDFSSKNSMVNHQLKLLGSAAISNETGRIQIPDTSQKVDLKHLAGRAIYSFPVRLLDPLTQNPASFETTFSFQFQAAPKNISKPDSDSDGGNLGGSGLTFILVPDEFTVGRPGPWLGMLNDACDEDYKAVGIEFDTRQNPEFGDPNDNHLGINLGSIVSTPTVNVSEFGVDLDDGSIYRAWITYYGQRRHIDIRLGPDLGDYPNEPVFSGPLDLSPFLIEYMFVGFSASTGNHTQIHNLISWNFTSISQASLRVPSAETCESKITVGGGSRGRSFLWKIPNGFFIFLAVVVLVLAALLSLYYNRKRKDRKKSNEVVALTAEKQRPQPPNKPRRFTIGEISSVTQGFRELQKLESDERSETYRGTLLNGCHVAVKRFSTEFFNKCGLDRRRVAKEIKAVGKIRHPNLVPIRGWCFDHRETMVVYDYIPNGSLENWLHCVGVLPWTRRFKVVRDVAEALSYLHSRELAHKNVRTSSVFLDVSFRAVLGDFGFVMSSAESKRFESVVGQRADVFEFGVFVLEVVAGRRKTDPDGGFGSGSDLLQWAWSMHEGGEKGKVVDKRMGSIVNSEQAGRVLDIGLLCTLNENKGRPTMEQVVEFLSLEKEVPELPPSRPVSLFPYSSTTRLCSVYSCALFK